MIDNPQKAAQLLASLKQAVPFTVTLVPTLVNYLRDQRISIAEQTQHTVSGLSYARDEVGIICLIGGPEDREGLVVSLTQVRVPTINAACSRSGGLSQPSRQEATEAQTGFKVKSKNVNRPDAFL